MTDPKAIIEFEREIIALSDKYKGRLVVIAVAQEIDVRQNGNFTCTGKLKAWDNHHTAGREALCSAHFIMHEQEEETTQPDHHRDVSKCH